jgi:hypothetical protein
MLVAGMGLSQLEVGHAAKGGSDFVVLPWSSDTNFAMTSLS